MSLTRRRLRVSELVCVIRCLASVGRVVQAGVVHGGVHVRAGGDVVVQAGC